jgi:hypothetical protein
MGPWGWGRYESIMEDVEGKGKGEVEIRQEREIEWVNIINMPYCM